MSTLDLFSVGRVFKTEPAESPAASSSHEHAPSRAAMSREQLVDQIITINPSATAGYLDQFGKPELGTYLDHLLNAQQPRGRHARWDRPGDAPAIMTRRRTA